MLQFTPSTSLIPATPMYTVSEKAGGVAIEFKDINAAAKAFHAADANDQPSVIRSAGGFAAVIAATVKHGDTPRSKSVGHAVVDDGAFKRSYEAILENALDPQKSGVEEKLVALGDKEFDQIASLLRNVKNFINAGDYSYPHIDFSEYVVRHQCDDEPFSQPAYSGYKLTVWMESSSRHAAPYITYEIQINTPEEGWTGLCIPAEHRAEVQAALDKTISEIRATGVLITEVIEEKFGQSSALSSGSTDEEDAQASMRM